MNNYLVYGRLGGPCYVTLYAWDLYILIYSRGDKIDWHIVSMNMLQDVQMFWWDFAVNNRVCFQYHTFQTDHACSNFNLLKLHNWHILQYIYAIYGHWLWYEAYVSVLRLRHHWSVINKIIIHMQFITQLKHYTYWRYDQIKDVLTKRKGVDETSLLQAIKWGKFIAVNLSGDWQILLPFCTWDFK